MNREKAGYLEGIVSILVNTILFVLKFWAGIVSGSLALTADAWHTLSDSLSSVFVIVGVKMASLKPDEEHPFGHGRWEQIASIFISFLLAVVAYEFFIKSVQQFNAGDSAHFGLLAIIVTIISIITKEGLAQYAFYIWRKTKNSTVKADGWHHRTDALSSVVVLVGIFLKNYFWWIDSALGIVISLMIFYAAFEIIKEAINKLLGETPTQELIDEVIVIIKSVEKEDLLPHHFHLHNYGTHQELTFHLKLDPEYTIEAGHLLVTKIERKIQNELNVHATIHLEPLGIVH